MKKTLFILSFFVLSVYTYAQTITEVFYPQFIQGVGSGNTADDRKVPFACRMTVAGLLPNATYRYYNKFVTDPAVVSDNGQGNYIIATQSGNFLRVTSASLATLGRYGEFTTDGSGSYTGWFIAEPTIATTHYQPGTQIYFRLMLNNGAGGGSVQTRLTAANTVTVLGFGSTPTTGSGIRSTAIAAFTAKNFVLLYDNDGGTGRPVAATFVESDGTDNNATTSGYAPFYANSVDGVDKAWGTIIPNNLATGIRRICQYSLGNGTALGCAVSPDGTFPAAAGGTLSTANASSGLTELAINGASITLPVTLVSFTASVLPNNKVNLQWRTSTEVNFSNFIVESSKNSMQFSGIGTRSATGDNSTYSLEDNLTPGVTYYRLKMVDIDGRFRYSQVIAVNGNLSGHDLAVFPNPAQNNLFVSHTKAKAGATIQVVGMSGARVAVQYVQEGALQTTVDVSRLTAGSYVLVYYNDDKKQNVQFKKQ